MPSVSSLEQASELLRAAGADGRRVRIGADLDASGMDRVLEHEAGDLTCTVEAGIRLSALAMALARAGQRLSLDPPGDPTIGACLAANLSGPLRHRFGGPRDLVLGVTLVLADGTVANAGGKVVKNVAGYDLGKLVCGSLGRLAFIARVSLRLHPAPADNATVVVETDDPAAVAAALLALAARSERARRAPSRAGWPCSSRAAPRRWPRRSRQRGRSSAATRRTVRSGPSPWHDRARRSEEPGSRPATCVRSSRACRRPSSARLPASRTSRTGDGRRDAGAGPAPAGARPRPVRPGTECSRERRPGRPPLPDERVRPLRLLPADVPDLPPLERGDGLAPRPDPADGGEPRRHDLAQRDRHRALRPLPRLHGLRHGLPVGRQVRPADRGDPRDDRDRDHAALRRPASCAGRCSSCSPTRAGWGRRCGWRRSAASCRSRGGSAR